MKHKKILLIFAFLTTVISLHAEGIHFSSDLLMHTIEVLECEQQLDSLPDGSSIVVLPSGMPIRVGKRSGRVVHLGSPLFSDLQYADQPLIYDYLEFAMLDHYCHISDNPYLFKNLCFLDGDWSVLEKVTTETPCTVNTQGGIDYEVIWSLGMGTQVRVLVPIEYDRLAMMSRQELELLFLEDLMAGNNDLRSTLSLPVKLYATDERTIFVQKGNHFILSTINQNSYFSNEDEVYTLICDPAFPIQTMANLVNADCDEMPMLKLELTVQRYDYQTATINVYLSDLLNYTKKQGCDTFWGLESFDNKVIRGTLYIVNPTIAYCHILRIQADADKLYRSNEIIEGKISLYTPLGNITNFFAKKEDLGN